MNYQTPEWAWARMIAKRRADFRCERCERMGRLEVHHKKPVIEGGEWLDQLNLEVLCRDCHISHHHGPQHKEKAKMKDELKRRLR